MGPPPSVQFTVFCPVLSIVSEMVESALREERDTCAVDAVSSVFMSILNAPGLDVGEKKAAIIDFIASGMQTVSFVASSCAA